MNRVRRSVFPFAALAFAVLAASRPQAQPAEGGLDCQYQNLLIDASKAAAAGNPEWNCGAQRSWAVRGSINGILQSCPPVETDFDPVLGNEGSNYAHGYRLEQIMSREGIVVFHTYGVHGPNALQAALMHVAEGQGSGKFAGATGVLAVAPEWPFDGDLRMTGYLCTPRT